MYSRPTGLTGIPNFRTMAVWKAIVAMSRNRVIGKDGKVPWNLPEDLEFLRKTCKGGVLVMGRTTFESVGKPLPYAHDTIVVSRTMKPREDVKVISDLSELEGYETDRTIWSFGGGRIYEAMLPKVRDLYVTLVKREVEYGDAYMPPFEHLFELAETLRDEPEFAIYRYRNKTIPV